MNESLTPTLPAQVMEFTVKRSEWLRGTGRGRLCAVLPDRGTCRCCLGFLGNALGFTDTDLMGRMFLTQIENFYGVRLTLRPIREQSIAGTNDKADLTDEYRERRLTEQFAEVGIVVHFVD